MTIGNIDLGERPVLLAPMEDVTDIGFRHLCKRYGASMVYTEFVSAEALVRSIKSTVSKLTISDEERPVGIQIYGRDTESMVEAAKIVEQAQVKTRLGWDKTDLIITDLAERLQDCGIQALTIHGRTRSQMYTGEADWTLIGEVKNNPRIHIPIIGNGDITSPEEAKMAFDRYGVDGVMVGRATFGRPWIFKEIRDFLDGRPADETMDFNWKLDVLKEQLRINVERIDEYPSRHHLRRIVRPFGKSKGRHR